MKKATRELPKSLSLLAERGRFELPRRCRLPDFESHARTLRSLRHLWSNSAPCACDAAQSAMRGKNPRTHQPRGALALRMTSRSHAMRQKKMRRYA